MGNFKHSKALGQNFLTDKNLLSAIVADAGVTAADTVIEVGAGQGALTEPLAKTGARIFSYEIDARLIGHLRGLEEQYPNLTVVNADIMKIADGDISPVTPYKVVANLPYYITTPVLFKFIGKGASVITVMVQKEVADRIVAPPGGKDYGVLSVSCQLAGNVKITRKVGRNMFTPPPSVDSAVVRLDITSAPDGRVNRLVRAAFSMRRKTLVNCLCGSGYDKQKVLSALAALGFSPDIRGERLSPADFVKLSTLLSQ